MNSQEKYAMLDRLNLCHRCEKARPAPGRKFCFDCLEKIAEYNAQHYSQKKANEYQARRRVLYQEKKAAGICVRCSKPATPRITTVKENRADRLKCLGNAVYWRQFYPIFQGIMEVMNRA